MSFPRIPASAPDLDILGDQVRIHPGGYIEPPARPNDASEPPLMENMARFRESPLDFLREVSLHVSGTGWRAYDEVIGQPIYYPGFTENMKTAVMATPVLQRKIKELAKRRVAVEEEQGLFGDAVETVRRREKRREEIETSLKEVAWDWTDAMICKFESKRFIRGAYYLCTQLLTRAYHQGQSRSSCDPLWLSYQDLLTFRNVGIHVSSEEVIRLRSVAEQAAKNKHSIIFLPCHRSHVDYVSMQLICFRLGIALPTVVAGDNLNFPIVGSFLQNAGASSHLLGEWTIQVAVFSWGFPRLLNYQRRCWRTLVVKTVGLMDLSNFRSGNSHIPSSLYLREGP